MTQVQKFLAQAKANAERKAAEMAALELSVWSPKHERELKEFFGETDASLRKRKQDLIKRAG